MRAALVCLALTLLTACQPTPAAPPPQGLALASDGLRPTGSTLRIDFWRTKAGVIAAVSKLLGQSPTSSEHIPNCGSITRYEHLTLTFIDGNFRGWTAKPGTFTTLPPLANDQVAAGKTCG